MTKKRGYPDRRGMGAESDPMAEQFVPTGSYMAQQIAIAHKLIAAGMEPGHVSALFLIPLELLSTDGPEPIESK